MTEREGAEGSQLSLALDFVPLRQRVPQRAIESRENHKF